MTLLEHLQLLVPFMYGEYSLVSTSQYPISMANPWGGSQKLQPKGYYLMILSPLSQSHRHGGSMATSFLTAEVATSFVDDFVAGDRCLEKVPPALLLKRYLRPSCSVAQWTSENLSSSLTTSGQSLEKMHMQGLCLQ